MSASGCFSMRVAKVAGVIVGLAVLSSAATADAQSLSRKMDLFRLQEQAGTVTVQILQSEGGACAPQRSAMKTIFDDPRFSRMDKDVQRPFLYAVMLCSEVKDLALALAAANRLEPLADGPSEIVAIYSVRMSEALQRGDTAGAARQFLALSKLQPAAVAEWEPEMMSSFDDLQTDDALATEVLKTLTGFAWTNPASQRAAANGWALAYARRLADAGRAEEAGRAVEKSDELYTRLMIAGDRRFSSIWERYEREGRFDWKALALAELERSRKTMADAPGQLRAVADAMNTLRAVGRHDEAIEVGEAFRARIQDGEVFEDGGTQAVQVILALGQALFEMGRYPAAEAAFKEAITIDGGEDSVEASMTWAAHLVDMGRAREALVLLDAVDRDYFSPYGLQWLESQRACAQAEFDPKAAEVTLTALRKSGDENPGAVSQALVCTNKIDDAAALLVKRLASPRHRAGGLDPYWITRPPPVVTPRRAAFESRRQAMLAHPDSLKALDAVGRKVEAPLAGAYWGGY